MRHITDTEHEEEAGSHWEVGGSSVRPQCCSSGGRGQGDPTWHKDGSLDRRVHSDVWLQEVGDGVWDGRSVVGGGGGVGSLKVAVHFKAVVPRIGDHHVAVRGERQALGPIEGVR